MQKITLNYVELSDNVKVIFDYVDFHNAVKLGDAAKDLGSSLITSDVLEICNTVCNMVTHIT